MNTGTRADLGAHRRLITILSKALEKGLRGLELCLNKRIQCVQEKVVYMNLVAMHVHIMCLLPGDDPHHQSVLSDEG